MKIEQGKKVTLHFALMLENGDLVDGTFEKDPATLIIGDGNLPEGFEKLIFGLEAPTEQTFDVPPEEAFSQPNPNNIQTIKRSQFSKDIEMVEGMVCSFADSKKAELPGVIKSFDDETVTVDFNHPLAGKALKFKVQIIDVQNP